MIVKSRINPHPVHYFSISIQLRYHMLDLNSLASCIDVPHVCFCVNDTALHPDKSEAILLGTHQRAHTYFNLATINVAGGQFLLVYHIRFVGATLDKNISKNNHGSAITKSVHYHISALWHINYDSWHPQSRPGRFCRSKVLLPLPMSTST